MRPGSAAASRRRRTSSWALHHIVLQICLISLTLLNKTLAFLPATATSTTTTTSYSSTTLSSTPLELNYYDPPQDDQDSSLAVDPNTPLIIGCNKYSHDTSLCAADAQSGRVLFGISKERLTRRKHDAGNIATLVETCLETLGLQLDNIQTTVANNHHHRIRPLEVNRQHLEWEAGLRINGGAEDGTEDPENLLLSRELSHHLAHAYSTISQAPFHTGVCVVMDGMGETYRTMLQGRDDSSYTSDLDFDDSSFPIVPPNLQSLARDSVYDWREAESVYQFDKTNGMDIRPIFKRFTPEVTPPTLYNHGFENMESLGALYSRASSHIFGDWNACGKVMGLAPWAVQLEEESLEHPIVSGSLVDGTLTINRTALEGLPLIARNDAELYERDGTPKKRYDFDRERPPLRVAANAVGVAHRIQQDLEAVGLDFVAQFREHQNVCLAGGVALNSVLNGRISRELGFKKTFIAPYPGDDGIAVGCCAFGLFGNKALEASGALEPQPNERPPVWNQPLSPYLGPIYDQESIADAVEWAEPWIEYEIVRDDRVRIDEIARTLQEGSVVAWYHGRSEFGPRALGHRSILADPREASMVRFINEKVKFRESFRPFAPSVLAEEADNWFDLAGCDSPYMSMTAYVPEDKRDLIPAVTHVDGSSRLQTVRKQDEPLYHALISKFFELTGVPMVLNTSFNTIPSEPIVESPRDAIRTFFYAMGSLDILVLGDYVIRRKLPDLNSLVGEFTVDGEVKIEPATPQRAGPVMFQSSFELGEDGPDGDEEVQTVTKVRMPARPTHTSKSEWFELLDDMEGELLSVCDGTVPLNDIMAQYVEDNNSDEDGQSELSNSETLLQNIVHRLVRLYENTLIYW